MVEHGGRSAVSWRAIARSVGMSAPSLYTYFSSLDDLFTELLVQSYRSLADTVRVAVEVSAGKPIMERLLSGPVAYRSWALDNPGQFNLLFTDQLPGFAAEPDGPTTAAQLAVFRPMAVVFAAAHHIDPTELAQPSPTTDRFIGLWGAFHGLCSLEVNHHLDWVDAGQLFQSQLRWHIDNLDLPAQ